MPLDTHTAGEPNDRQYVTEEEATALTNAVSRVLPAWFAVKLFPVNDFGERDDYVVVDRIAGPPVGAFGITRDGEMFDVVAHPDYRARFGPYEYPLGKFSTALEAVEGIAWHLEDHYDLAACLPRADAAHQ